MDEKAVKRALAAIVMADVVGYSRLMGEDEAATLRRLKQYRSGFIDATIESHRGRIVNSAGDSLLIEFGSVVDATRCAITLQQELAERNAPLPEARRIAFRLGVNIGEVIVEDGALFGDSVNIAARLQALAEPGGVCLSGAAHEQVRGKIAAEFVDQGAHQVKNIARPVEVFTLSARAIESIPRPAPPAATARSRRPAIICGATLVALAAGFAAHTFAFRGANSEFAARLDAILVVAQASASDKARAKLISDYVSATPHRAFAIAPKARAHWWTADWPSAEAAGEKALERCQLAYAEPCALAALDEAAMTPAALAPRDMPRAGYAGDFDPERVPGVRRLVARRADVLGYPGAPEPKAAAIHPRGILTVVTGAASQRRAEAQALKLCNDDGARKEGDGPCYLYASGAKVVLPRRQTGASPK
jgi:class 3 adenylate cyclase